ncbi:MAG TPA: hypothetical protein VGH99_20635 [Pseudonocardia sp.]|jgi:hypothetical protein
MAVKPVSAPTEQARDAVLADRHLQLVPAPRTAEPRPDAGQPDTAHPDTARPPGSPVVEAGAVDDRPHRSFRAAEYRRNAVALAGFLLGYRRRHVRALLEHSHDVWSL